MKVAGNAHLGFDGSRPRRSSCCSTTPVCTRRRGRPARRAPPSRRTCSRRWASRATTALSSIRLSLGYASTDADVDVALAVVPEAVAKLRAAGATHMSRSRVLVAMSGGVDSSVAAALLLEQRLRRHRRHAQVLGWRVRLRVLQRLRRRGRPPGGGAVRHPPLRLQLRRRFRPPRSSIRTSMPTPSGHTPNPCVECNRAIKFGRLLDRADALGFDSLATGHHARVRRRGGSTSSRAVPTTPRTSRTCSTCSGSASSPGHCSPSVSSRRLRCARTPPRSASAPRTSRRAWMSASSSGRAQAFLDARSPLRAGRRRRHRRRGARHPRRRRLVHDRSAPRRRCRARRTALCRRRRHEYGATSRSDHAPSCSRPRARPRPHVRRRRARSRQSLYAQVRAHGVAGGRTLDGDAVCFAQPQPRVAPGQVVALYDGDALVGGGIAA